MIKINTLYEIILDVLESKAFELIKKDNLVQFKHFCSENTLNIETISSWKFLPHGRSLLVLAVEYSAFLISKYLLLELHFPVDLSEMPEINPIYYATRKFYEILQKEHDLYGKYDEKIKEKVEDDKLQSLRLVESLININKKAQSQNIQNHIHNDIIADMMEVGHLHFLDHRIIVLLLKNVTHIDKKNHMILHIYNWENECNHDYESSDCAIISSELLELVLQKIATEHILADLKKITHSVCNDFDASELVRESRWSIFKRFVLIISNYLSYKDACVAVQNVWHYACGIYHQCILFIRSLDQSTVSIPSNLQILLKYKKDPRFFCKEHYTNEGNNIKSEIGPEPLRYQAAKAFIYHGCESILEGNKIISNDYKVFFESKVLCFLAKCSSKVNASRDIICSEKDFVPSEISSVLLFLHEAATKNCLQKGGLCYVVPCPSDASVDSADVMLLWDEIFLRLVLLESFYEKFTKKLFQAEADNFESSNAKVFVQNEIYTVLEDLTLEGEAHSLSSGCKK